MPQGTNLVALGPLRMTTGSRSIALVGVAVVCAVLALLATLLLLMARRLAAMQREH
jgi:uncharacterized membrane protein